MDFCVGLVPVLHWLIVFFRVFNFTSYYFNDIPYLDKATHISLPFCQRLVAPLFFSNLYSCFVLFCFVFLGGGCNFIIIHMHMYIYSIYSIQVKVCDYRPLRTAVGSMLSAFSACLQPYIQPRYDMGRSYQVHVGMHAIKILHYRG